MERRDFLWMFGSGVVACTLGCERQEGVPGVDASADDAAATTPSADDASSAGSQDLDACIQNIIKLHDTYAQALYLDGTNGPLTGVITTAHVIAGSIVTMDFWHGHNGMQHRFTLTPQHFADLKHGKRITVGTTTVDGHAHTLFVDPKDEEYRVAGAPDVDVPIGC
ncbi:MAG TPA: hypothetical protein VMZ53_03075 [Kofleriaceae bacterium]|nr:hypothetical protein [Kofleriaceae bacterium]